MGRFRSFLARFRSFLLAVSRCRSFQVVPRFSKYPPLTFSCRQRETLDIMNAFVNSLFDWNYARIVNPEENEEIDEENTDEKGF